MLQRAGRSPSHSEEDLGKEYERATSIALGVGLIVRANHRPLSYLEHGVIQLNSDEGLNHIYRYDLFPIRK